jgi:fructokinase
MPTATPSPSEAPVLSLGEILIDFIATEQVASLAEANTFVARNGGAPANVAVALARLGVPSAYCGVVGDDAFGSRLINGLETEKVDASRVRTTDLATTIAFAWKNKLGDGQFWLRREADSTLSPDDVDRAGIAGVAAIGVGSVSLATEPSRSAIYHAVNLAASQDVPVCFDVNLRPTLWPDLSEALPACRPVIERATLLKLSLDDARDLFDGADDPDMITRLIDQLGGAPHLVLTDGERGAWFRPAGGALQFVPALRVAAVEPTGAGDAFLAALISRLRYDNWSAPVEADIQYAAAAGALATLREGAWDGLPTAAELDTFLATSATAGR